MNFLDTNNNQNNQPIIPAEIRSFLEGLLADANMTSLDAEMKEEMINELFVRLDNFITATIVDNLPAENLEPFIQMNEQKKSKEEIETYLKNNVPNSQEIFSKALMNFRDMYLGNIMTSRNEPDQSSEAPVTKVGSN